MSVQYAQCVHVMQQIPSMHVGAVSLINCMFASLPAIMVPSKNVQVQYMRWCASVERRMALDRSVLPRVNDPCISIR